MKILSFVIFYFLATTAHSFDTTIYVDQNQHNTFHAFGNDRSALTSNCFLNDERTEGLCTFHFRYKDNSRKMIRVNYSELSTIHTQLLAALRSLRDQWKADHPVNFLNRLAFRDQDHQFIDNLVIGLQNEPLPLRVLLPRQSRDVPQFWSSNLMSEVMSTYEQVLRPFDIHQRQREEELDMTERDDSPVDS